MIASDADSKYFQTTKRKQSQFIPTHHNTSTQTYRWEKESLSKDIPPKGSTPLLTIVKRFFYPKTFRISGKTKHRSGRTIIPEP
jgi:hypothetical protein